MGKTFVIASGKGGTGKTMVSANLGISLVKLGYKVIIVDMDTGLRNLDLYFGLENNIVYDVNDVMKGVCRIKQAMIREKSLPNLYIMAASPQKNEGEISPLHTKILCEKLEEMFDYIIIDSPAGLGEDFRIAIGGADYTILVINPEIASKRDAEMVESYLTEHKLKNVFYLINKIDMDLIRRGYAPKMDEILQRIEDKTLGVLPYDENIHISTNLGSPIAFKERHPIADNFKRIAKRIEKI